MRRTVDDALADYGTVWWLEYLILTVLCDLGPISQTALTERTGIDRTRMSQTVAYLDDRALVGLESGVDRRKRLVHPTYEGRAELAAAREVIEDAERSALLPLDPRERARLVQLLAKAIPRPRRLAELLY